MESLTNLLENVCTYFCKKYGCIESYDVHSFNNNSFLGTVYVLNILRQPEWSEICVVINKNAIRLISVKPCSSSCERLQGEIISASIDTFCGSGSLVVYPPDKTRGHGCIMFHSDDKFTSDFKIEFLSKLNELFHSGKYSLEIKQEFA